MIRLMYVCAVCALAGVLSVTALAVQVRPVTEGVYSSAQAARGQALYKQHCVTCHGDALEGGVGPMLAGEGFVGAWGGRTMAELVDKIQNTMPLQAPGTLTRPQATDIAAYMLQVGKFKPGSADLDPAGLAQISFPAAAAAPAAAASGGISLTPSANLAQLMRAITFPNANIIFNVQVKEPVTTRPPQPIPFDYVLWGNAQYYGWQAVDQAALALIESTPLFLLPGRRCENGRPAPIDRADYKQFTQALIDVSREAYKASQSRNVDAVVGLAEKLNDACANCHKVYRDGAAEGSTRGLERCQ